MNFGGPFENILAVSCWFLIVGAMGPRPKVPKGICREVIVGRYDRERVDMFMGEQFAAIATLL